MLGRVLPGIGKEIEDDVVAELVRLAIPEALEEVLREDMRGTWRLISGAVVGEMIEEVAQEALEEAQHEAREARFRAVQDLVVEDVLKDMCEEITAEVWDEETPQDSFVMLSPAEKRQPRLKPLGKVQDHQGFWRTAAMTTHATLFYTTLHSTHMT